MTRFRVLVVDDEPLARETVIALLRADAEIDSIAECTDGVQAQETIARDRPDIVFLDVEMPGLDGLRLADAIPSGGPVIVFTTAFSRYAVDAFDVAATDYVLKPFSDQRFLEALTRAKRRVRERRLGALASEMAALSVELQQDDVTPGGDTPQPRFLQRLSFRHGSRLVVVKVEEVIWVEAEDYCVMIHSTRGNHLIRASLSSLEQRLDPATFVRVHRTAIVNLEHVREMHDANGLSLRLSDGSQVGVSRARRQHVEEAAGTRLL